MSTNCVNGGKLTALPRCKKTYVLYNYNYSRSVDCALEDHTHQIEQIMEHIDKDRLWGTRSATPAGYPNAFINPYGQTNGAVNACGWTHFPPNGQDHYDWRNTTVVQSDCEDWNPQRNGTVKGVSAATWSSPLSCFPSSTDCDGGFKLWWMQNIPGQDNPLRFNGKRLRNWWDVIADVDAVVATGTGLLCP